MLELEKIKEVNVILDKKDVSAATSAIVELGIMHLVQISEIEDLDQSGITKFNTQHEQDILREKLSIISSVAEKANIELLGPDSNNQKVFGVGEDVMEAIKKASFDIIRLCDNEKAIKEEIKRLNNLKHQLGEFSVVGYKDISSNQHSFMHTTFGRINKEVFPILEDKLKDMLHILVKASETSDKICFLAVVLKKDKELLEKILKDMGFEPVVAPKGMGVSEKAIEEVSRNLEERELALKENSKKIESFRESNTKLIRDSYYRYHIEQIVLSAFEYYSCTGETVIVSGWIPADKVDVLKDKISQVTDNRCIFEENETENIDKVANGETSVPVKIKERKFISSFIGIVENFGIPKYNTIDPSFFAAFTFLLIFGFMFGDVGHGLVLFLLGLGISFKFKAKKEVMRLGRVVSCCGISSAIFGFLYGSIFGVETLLPHIWLEPMHDTGRFFTAAISVGVFIISMGVVLNIVNKFRNKEYIEGALGRLGIAGALFYWGALAIAVRFLLNIKTLPVSVLYIIVLGALVLLFGKNIFVKLLGLGHSNESWTVVMFENVIEMLELLIGYLTGTISFIRIAAFALSHIGLFTAVFMLSDMAAQFKGGEVFSWVILVFGNILIIGFEGIIVAIQSLRLEYYEFFGKFFVDGGNKFNPIKVK